MYPVREREGRGVCGVQRGIEVGLPLRTSIEGSVGSEDSVLKYVQLSTLHQIVDGTLCPLGQLCNTACPFHSHSSLERVGTTSEFLRVNWDHKSLTVGSKSRDWKAGLRTWGMGCC